MDNNDVLVNMHKSTTNRSLTNQPDSGIVSRSGLGKRVVVNGHYGGVLRYMGQVAGKEGIFCGIELDQPVGKNDGTHEGAFYFGCRPGHGVFAPCHKVQMETVKRVIEEKSLLNSKAEKTLSRSAMPSLSSERHSNIPSTSSNIPQMPMDWSLMSMSTVSNNSDSSYVIRTSNNNNNIDLMANSQATYTVFESDCPMLADLEISETSLLRLDEEDDDEDNRTTILGWIMNENGFPRTFRPDESIVLDGPSLGMDLPVISSPEPDEDLETPIAETKTISGLINNKQNRSHLKLEGLEQQKSRKNKKEIENKSPVKMTEMISFMTDGKNDNNNTCYLKTNVSSRNVKHSQREKEAASKSSFNREEKTRISVFQSIPMATKNLSEAARNSKPKQPSKAQMIMDKLKSSIEAEKHRSKKEVRSKLLSGVVTSNKDKCIDEAEQSKTVTIDKSPSRQFSSSATTPTSTNGSRNVAKSSSTVKMPSSVPRATIVKPHSSISTPLVTSTTPNKHSSLGRSSRQVLGSKENTVLKDNSSKIIKKETKISTKTSTTNANLVKKNLENEQKKIIEQLQQDLKSEKKTSDVFIIVAKTLNQQNILVQGRVNKLEELLEQNNLNNELALQKLEGKWKENLLRVDELHKNEVDDVRSLLLSDHQNKLEQLQNENEKTVKEYIDQIIALKSQLFEQEEKHKIQLEKSETQRIQELGKDLSSLTYALQVKTDELNKLRSDNRELLFKMEKLVEKEGLLIKLEKKNEDLREEVNRLKQLERSLLSQLESFRIQRDQALSKNKEIEQQKEVLEYQLTMGSNSNLNASSSRSPKSTPIVSIERPNSSCLSGRSQHLENDMSKSIDSALSLVKCYQIEGRAKSQNTPTKVYTPRECYELDDSLPEKETTRTIDFDVNEESSLSQSSTN